MKEKNSIVLCVLYVHPSIVNPRSTDNMIVKSNKDGSYVVTWVPSCSGSYTIQLFIDGRDAGTHILGPITSCVCIPGYAKGSNDVMMM